ncbi:MAG: hypothetical protein WA728_07360 [Xanthobacteraceae bacterium]
MAAICAMDQWRERIEANPANGDYLARLPARQFIDVLTRWNGIFVAGGQHPVMGVSPDELRAIAAPRSSSPATTKLMRAPVGSRRTTSSQAVCFINCPERTRMIH